MPHGHSKNEEHLADPSTYKELSSNPIQVIRNDVLSTLNYLYHTHQIDDITRHQPTPPKPARIPPFYGLLKLQKPNIPLQPINSISMWQPHRSTFELCHTLHTTSCGNTPPSYIRNRKHFLQLLSTSLPPLPENAILVTADVTSDDDHRSTHPPTHAVSP